MASSKCSNDTNANAGGLHPIVAGVACVCLFGSGAGRWDASTPPPRLTTSQSPPPFHLPGRASPRETAHQHSTQHNTAASAQPLITAIAARFRCRTLHAHLLTIPFPRTNSLPSPSDILTPRAALTPPWGRRHGPSAIWKSRPPPGPCPTPPQVPFPTTRVSQDVPRPPRTSRDASSPFHERF